MDYRVRFITKHWDHHSLHSGYDQLVARLGESIAPVDMGDLRQKWVPGRIAVWLAAHSGNRLYSYIHFYHEVAAMKEMLSRRSATIYHTLYGDDSYRYLGCFGRSRNSRIVASFHLPPSALGAYFHSVDHLKRLDAVIVVGRNQVPFFSSVIDEKRIHFVPHGVDTCVFMPGLPLKSRCASGGVCLFVGGHRRDFATMKRVTEIVNSLDRNIRFIIVTLKDNLQMFEGLTNVALECGIPEPALLQLYQSSDLLIQPLEDSTANNAILEGLACGLPVITTDTGAVRDYVDDSCARLCLPNNPEQMAHEVVTLIKDVPKRLEMSKNARIRALQFDWATVVTMVKEVYSHAWQS